MSWLAKWPKDNSHLHETTVYADFVRMLVELRGGGIDFDVGTRRCELAEHEQFWQGRVPLDWEL